MKKRILSLLLAVITILQMFPVFALPTIAEDEVTGIDVADMEVGKLYTAEFLYKDETFLPQKPSEEDPDSLVWKGYGEIEDYEAYVPVSDFPADLIVKRISEDDLYYVYVTNEDWQEEYDEYRFVSYLDIIITGEYVAPPADDGLVYGEVGLVMDGETVETLTISEGEKTYVFTELSDKIQGTPSYRWQLLIDPENDRWADVQDYVYPYAVISEALIANAGLETGVATLRCIATRDGTSYASGELNIAVDPDAPAPEPFVPAETETEEETDAAEPAEAGLDALGIPAGMMARSAGAARSGATEAFQIVVNYKFMHTTAVDEKLNGSTAANTFTVTLPSDSSYTGTVTSPPVVGYLPYVLAEDKDYVVSTAKTITYDGQEYYLAESIVFDTTNQTTEINVFYIPQSVNFLVKFYEQNLHNDEYVLAGTEIRSGLADAAVGEGLDTARTGFTALYYDPNQEINGDGTATVEIYYDRNYYLIDFDLISDEAYGATPYYVRYNSQVMLPTPTRPGYTFTGWTLTTTDVGTIYPASSDGGDLITVQHNLNYKAEWYASTTSYTIAYWLEDPEYVDPVDPNDVDPNEKYKIWGIQNVTGVTAGTTVDGPGAGDVPTDWTTYSALVKDDGNVYRTINELNYLDFVVSDQDVEVKGDGSTVVNVYYDRKEYLLKFYYARSLTSNGSTTWYVAGQTNSFAETPDNAELDCLENNSGQFGQVQSKPTIKDGIVAKKGYTEGTENHSETTGNWWNPTTVVYTYHYLSFTAKYGADISDQYPCDIFNPVERTSNQSSNGWNEKTVLMSAWSGEYNVMFSQVGGNQTMKGKYQILDYRMLWDPNASGWNTTYNDNTVSYLAFWENAINVNWNIPELYRYKIWLQVLDGHDLSDATTYVYNGITYYLKDVYDTCDNSQVSEQTQPTLIGFTRNGYTQRGDIGSTNYNANTWTDQPDLTRDEISDIKNNIMPETYSEAWIVNYFYTRNTADLSFSDTYTTPEVIKVPYEQSLSGYATKVPNYPSSIEEGAIVFAGDLDGDGVGDGTGWYLDENYTLPFSFNTVMGVDNIQLYAKWEDCPYTAKIYLDSKKETMLGDPQTVLFGSQIKEPDYKAAQATNPAYEKLIFAGWYYMDESEEKRFDFNTMVLKQDLEIYAKWTSKVPVSYTIYYRGLKNGVVVDVAEPTKGVSLAGISKSFTAKVGTELYTEYQTGYFPEIRSTSIMMSNAGTNELTFEYASPTDSITYTVDHNFVSDEFAEILGGNTLTLSKVYTISNPQNASALVTVSFRTDVNQDSVAEAAKTQLGKDISTADQNELWSIVKNLSPDYFEQNLIITSDPAANIATFNWVGRGMVGTYQVIHYFQNLDGTYVADISQQFVGNLYHPTDNPTEVTATPIERYGFIENTIHNERVPSGKITSAFDGGLVLKLYYDRVKYTYTVHHYKVGTATKVAEDVTVQDVPFGTVVKVSKIAQNITGYTFTNGDASFEISQNNQEIICYYQGQEVLYYYQIAGGSGGTLNEYTDKAVVGSVPEKKSSVLTLQAGYTLNRWYYTVSGIERESTVPREWLSDDQLTVTLPVAPAEWAGKSIYIYAEVLPTSLTITSQVTALTDTNLNWVTEDQSFIYLIEGTVGEQKYSIRVAVPEGESKTIYGLPIGDYTITVESAWSWRYEQPTVNYDTDGKFSFGGEEILNFQYAAPTSDNNTSGYYYITDEAYIP